MASLGVDFILKYLEYLGGFEFMYKTNFVRESGGWEKLTNILDLVLDSVVEPKLV